VVVATAGIVGIGALFGGYGLLSDAEGLGAKEAWLEGTPFPDYTVPGIVLLVVIGGGMLATAAAALRRTRVAAPAALAMGLALLVWGGVETITIGYRGGGQLLLLAIFVVGPAVPLIWIGAGGAGRNQTETEVRAA
jgi:peptidoglycan/LPS O-acetylase OafA/YrhL